ncbi:hypothetical protein [Nitrosomonas ureae]|uniref:Hemolysin-type calcium-binding repeat-containing protein n=1 Tax=Nitrosomonas ureae TaxID=44577 RepID=A0A1H9BEU7_9PROT|nr:hypothetical protein [Nitrosomonas ureae]SEP87415.1 hypothetical protein SAMN05421510_100766 [Nitrosomonas ureae]
MIGQGSADSFDGGAGNDYIRISSGDFELVDGGTGTDTLGLTGSNFNLDLSGVIDKIHGIEAIALYGNGDTTLTLMAQDVIDLSDNANTLRNIWTRFSRMHELTLMPRSTARQRSSLYASDCKILT